MIKMFGQKDVAGNKNIFPEEQVAQYKMWWGKLKDGAMISVTYKLYRPHKSWNQVKNHFGNALQRIVDVFEDNGWDASILYRLEKPTGVPVNVIMLQQFFYAMFPTCNDEGKLITMSSDEFTTQHCAERFENIRNYAASQWSIVIPDPDINWKETNANGTGTADRPA